MRQYHKKRMRKYRIFVWVAAALAVLSTVFFFAFPAIRILTIILAVIGIGVISITNFQRHRWVRLYENLVYAKKHREKVKKEMEAHQPDQGRKYYRHK
jgi:hypothetical protein